MCILKTENEKRRKNERSVSLVRFFRALKCVKFCFCVVKYKVIGTIAAVLQMYTFLGGGVHLVGKYAQQRQLQRRHGNQAYHFPEIQKLLQLIDSNYS